MTERFKNKLLDIELILLQYESYVATFSIRMEHNSLQVFFNNFLLKDATDRSKISSDKKRLFVAVCLYPLSFFANTFFKTLILSVMGKRMLFFHWL